MKVLICGSCVSRDIFSFVKNEHRVSAYLPRMSMATAFGAPAPDDMITAARTEIPGLLHRSWTLNDLEKNLEKVLTSTVYDIVLLDFIEERLNLAVTATGSFFTCGDKFRNSAAARLKCELIRSQSARHLQLWKEGLDTFARCVDPKKVIVNKVYLATESNDGSYFDEKSSTRNALFLEGLYQHVAANYSFKVMTHDRDVFVSDAAHKWGKTPIHLIPDYYVGAMKTMNSWTL